VVRTDKRADKGKTRGAQFHATNHVMDASPLPLLLSHTTNERHGRLIRCLVRALVCIRDSQFDVVGCFRPGRGSNANSLSYISSQLVAQGFLSRPLYLHGLEDSEREKLVKCLGNLIGQRNVRPLLPAFQTNSLKFRNLLCRTILLIANLSLPSFAPCPMTTSVSRAFLVKKRMLVRQPNAKRKALAPNLRTNLSPDHLF
jgi:hypothetical protein